MSRRPCEEHQRCIRVAYLFDVFADPSHACSIQLWQEHQLTSPPPKGAVRYRLSLHWPDEVEASADAVPQPVEPGSNQ